MGSRKRVKYIRQDPRYPSDHQASGLGKDFRDQASLTLATKISRLQTG